LGQEIKAFTRCKNCGKVIEVDKKCYFCGKRIRESNKYGVFRKIGGEKE